MKNSFLNFFYLLLSHNPVFIKNMKYYVVLRKRLYFIYFHERNQRTSVFRYGLWSFKNDTEVKITNKSNVSKNNEYVAFVSLFYNLILINIIVIVYNQCRLTCEWSATALLTRSERAWVNELLKIRSEINSCRRNI